MENLCSLSQFFEKKILRIPNYQRGYSWEDEQLEEFFEDVYNLPEKGNHYTGLISLKELTNEKKQEKQNLWYDADWLLKKDYHLYHIVDGQQRLTTIIILLQAIVETYLSKSGKTAEEIIVHDVNNDITLADIIEKYIVKIKPDSDNSISTYLIGYEVDKPSDDYLKNKILNPSYVGEINESFYTINLDSAKEKFLEKLDELYKTNKNFDEIEKIYRKLVNNLKFNVYLIGNEFNVNIAFETMNNRGKKLTTLELLKNRLFYITSLFNLSKDEENSLIDKINQTWKTIYSYLGKDKKQKLPDDDFLIAHSYIYFGYISELKKSYSQFLLKRYFKPNRILKKSSKNKSNVTEDNKKNDVDLSKGLTRLDIIKYMDSLKSLVPYWYMLHTASYETDIDEINDWLTKLKRLDYNYYKPLVLVALSKKNITEEKKLELLKSIERFIFVIFRLCGYQATNNRNQIYKYTHSLYLDEISIDEIIEYIDNLFALSDNNVLPFSAVERNITSLFRRDGFYSWSSNRYFLYEYESYLVEKNRGICKITDEYFISKNSTQKVSIEHIFPQSENAKKWIDIFKKYTLEQRNKFRGTLGNLLPLSLDINRELQADEFVKKCERYKKGSYSEQEVSENKMWNDKTILDRGMRLVRFMEDRWGFHFENDKDRKKVLGLEFMVVDEDEKKDVYAPIYNEDRQSSPKKVMVKELNEEIYLKIGTKVYAKGKYQNGGILIKKGSKLRTNIEASNSYMKNKVELARKNPKIKDGIFIDDVFYSTPSMAANVILGNNKNGWTSWKNSSKVTLDELVRK